MTTQKEIITIINSKIHYDDKGCWIWLGYVNDKNFCRLYIKGKSFTVHRYLFSQNDNLSTSDYLINSCKSTNCVNPKHYYKLTRKETSIAKEIPIKDRLLASIIKDNSTGCWNWQKKKNKKGYGHIIYRNKHYRAHRLSYEVFKHKLTKPIVLHICDNPSCINPDHLKEGTMLDNVKDAISKGRMHFQKIKNL